MLVAPVPVVLLIALFEFGKIAVFAMILLGVNSIRLIFLTVPCMVVVVLFVVIGHNLVIVGAQRSGCHRKGDYKGSAQQGRIAKTGNGYFHTCNGAGVWPIAIAAPMPRAFAG